MASKILIVIFLITISSVWSRSIDVTKNGCSIDLTAFSPEPVLVSSNGYRFLYPEPEANEVRVTPGASVILSCPGVYRNTATVSAQCVTDQTFRIDNANIDLEEVSCSQKPHDVARFTGSACEGGGREIEVGFDLGGGRFSRQLAICFDDSRKSPLYAAYNVTRSIGHHESKVARPFFAEDDFYGDLKQPVNRLYSRNAQRATINRLVGLSPGSTKYVRAKGDLFLARGHLAPKADFVYAPQQVATFHYVNSAPQWQSFNGKNWQKAESDTRDYAEQYELDLVVYTGIYGVSTLPHEDTGEEVELFFYNDDANDFKAIPIPKIYWKVVYDPHNKRGVALVGVNNPYATNIENEIICEDVSEQISWLTWDAKNTDWGYSYACTVENLKKVVDYVPDLNVNDLLI